MDRLFGIVPPVVTPYNADESVDEGGFRALLSFLVEKGVHALFLLGSAGEGLLMAMEERKHLAEVTVDEVRGRVPVMIHTSHLTTEGCVELTRHAAGIGADAVSILPPFYYRYSDEAIFRHIKAAADAAPSVAVYVYNNPTTTGNPISVALVERLAAECPNFRGIKDSCGVTARTLEFIRALGQGYAVLTGCNETAIADFVIGCSGAIASLANAFPETAVAMWDAYRAGDLARAQEKLDLLIRARAAMVKNGGVPAQSKAMLSIRGLSLGGVRRPMLAPSPEQRAAVEAVCRELGLLTPIS